MGVRVTIASNRDRGKRAVVVVDAPAKLEQLTKIAKNKLRLKATRFFAEGGVELADAAPVQQDLLILCSTGEDYAPPGYAAANPLSDVSPVDSTPAAEEAPRAPPPALKGLDDTGTWFEGLPEFWSAQAREAWYGTNREWWQEGYGGHSNEEAMIGDTGSDEDLELSRQFLVHLSSEGLLGGRSEGRGMRSGMGQVQRALDIGAGAGRVTKGLLLSHFDEVHLVEGCDHWLQQSRRSLGKKRTSRCHFYLYQLQEASQSKVPFPTDGRFALVWIQFVLQYLTDDDAVALLSQCRNSAASDGVIVVKENHAEGLQRRAEVDGIEAGSVFFVETPAGQNGCYDISRPDAHHRWLFEVAGLEVVSHHWGDELVTYALKRV